MSNFFQFLSPIKNFQDFTLPPDSENDSPEENHFSRLSKLYSTSINDIHPLDLDFSHIPSPLQTAINTTHNFDPRLNEISPLPHHTCLEQNSSANVKNGKLVQKLQNDLVSAKDEISTLEQKYHNIKAENKKYKESNQKTEKLKKEIMYLKKNLHELNQRNANFIDQINYDQGVSRRLKLENDNLHTQVYQLNNENLKLKQVVSQQISLLNQKNQIIDNLSNQIKKEKDESAEIVCNMGILNKYKDIQLNNNLPSSLDLNLELEKFINSIEEYYTNTKLMELNDHDLVPLISVIFKICFSKCTDFFKFPHDILLKYKKPSDKQTYYLKCLLYSLNDSHLNAAESCIEDVKNLILKFIDSFTELELTKKFVNDCCKFIWTVLLTHPEAAFDEYKEDQNEEIDFSFDKHKSFGKIENGKQMVVHTTIIPSILRVDNGAMETKSYVYLREKFRPIY